MATEDATDRISDLPQVIVHHILSYLPTKDVYKTSALSKTFLSFWSSFPVIVLDGSLCNFSRFDEFMNPSRTIQLRNIETELQIFKLKLPRRHPESDHRIDDAIRFFAIKKQVKELNLKFCGNYYPLPIFTASWDSITSLKLRGLRLNYFDQLIIGCPMIERLRVRDCFGFSQFKFSSTTIRSIEFSNCAGLSSIEIESSSLEKFTYKGCPKYRPKARCKIDISKCKLLKVLSLADDALISDEWVKLIIPLLPQLEDLKLSRCSKLEELIIRNENMKRVTLMECGESLKRLEIVGTNLECLIFNAQRACKIKFDAPKYVSVVYCNDERQSSWNFQEPLPDADAVLSIQTQCPLSKSYYVNLLNSIAFFVSNKDLTLVCNSTEKLVIPHRFRQREADRNYHLEHVKIEGVSRISTELVDCLLWLIPNLHTLCFVADGEERLIKFRYDLGIKENYRQLCYPKTIELKNFGNVNGLNLKKYFLLNGKAVCTSK